MRTLIAVRHGVTAAALTTAVVLVLLSGAMAPVYAGNCNWVSAPTAMNFGPYSVFAPADDTANSTFTIRCTPNTYGRVTVTPVSVPYRTASSGGNTANYNLYLDAGGTQIWGDAITGGYTYDRYSGTSGTKVFTDSIYGIAPAGQSLAPGTYTATVIVQLSESNNPNGPWTADAPVAGYPVTITLVVSAECRVDTFALSFTYDPFAAAPATASSVVKVYCTPGTSAISTTLDSGLNPLMGQKRMTNTVDYLNYSAALTGATSGASSSSLVPIANGFPLSGSIPAGQDVSTGTYYDTLQALVNY